MKVELSNISKTYGSHDVLNDVNLTISEGTVCCLLGKNGAGKTTIINSILGLITTDEGTITYDEEEYELLPDDIKKRMGSVLDNGSLIEELTALDFLKISAKMYGVPAQESKKRINDLTDLFFEDARDMDKPLVGFSTGMKKKISLSAAILHTPDFLVLDEPFSGLDPIAANQVINLILQYKSSNRSIFLSSHDLSYVEKVATHIAVLSEGSIAFHDTMTNFTKEGTQQLDSALLAVLQSEKDTPKPSLSWI